MSNDLMHVKGLRELQAMLGTLPAKIEANIMRAAMRAGAKEIAREAKLLAYPRNKKGKLQKTIRYNTTQDKRVGKVKAYVRAGGRGKRAGGAFYARFVEFGTKPHVIKVKPPRQLLAVGVPMVNHPGARPYPFMRPAMDTKGHAAVVAMGNYIRKRLRTQYGLNVPVPDPSEDLRP